VLFRLLRIKTPNQRAHGIGRLLEVGLGGITDPVWDLIRNDSGFQEVLAGKKLIGTASR
jgi:hypothetical protein